MIWRERDKTIPAAIAVGLRAPRVAEIVVTRSAIDGFELHAENYMAWRAGVDTARRLHPDTEITP
jgi:hypothetical protein